MTLDGVDSLYEFHELLRRDPESNKAERLEFLRGSDQWERIHRRVYLNLTGYYIDTAWDLGNRNAVVEGVDLVQQFLNRDLSPRTRTRAHYQLANGEQYQNILDPETQNEPAFTDNEYVREQIVALRKSLEESGIQATPDTEVRKRFVNLGNALDSTGRAVEAIDKYESALSLYPNHPQALGNRGMTKIWYGSALYNEGETVLFLHSANQDLTAALSADGLHPEAIHRFRESKRGIEEFDVEWLGFDRLEKESLGDTDEERRYREWVLSNRLFLNPLNDISTHTSVAEDTFHLPSIITEIDEPLPYPGLYNQMKQEYVSARYMFYEGLHAGEDHFSDQDVTLANTMDYPAYGYGTEQMKAGLRLAYSIFDKIAFFLNDYLNLEHHEEAVTFGNFWYENTSWSEGLHERFEGSENWLLNALYWLRKDFYGGPFEVEESLDIAPSTIERIRNGLEHRYLKVHRELVTGSEARGIEGPLKESITDDELIESGIEMLKISRAGLIYLSLAVHFEEKMKEAELEDPVVPLPTDWFRDEWKR